jgi:hypothetical protein
LATLYIHIGMQKTGSTSIQVSFGLHDRSDIRYLALPRKNYSAIPASIFHTHPELYFAEGGKNRSTQEIANQRAIFFSVWKYRLPPQLTGA